MDFETAEKLKRKNAHLIGKKDKGATIEELILVPTNVDLADAFLKLYLQTLDGKKSISPFAEEDMCVVAVFDKHRIASGFFFHTDISNLPESLGVVME